MTREELAIAQELLESLHLNLCYKIFIGDSAHNAYLCRWENTRCYCRTTNLDELCVAIRELAL
jgi:hypothetical protein